MHRVHLINHLCQTYFPDCCHYLEIGVRDPRACFDHVCAAHKLCVDPGTEQLTASASFVCTSDQFFEQLRNNRIPQLEPDHQWNIIFIDGLHLADQVHRDIANSLKHITNPGFVLLHDVNPEHWQRAHSDYDHYLSQGGMWNGTVWKAFYHARTTLGIACYTVDTDQGIGIIETHSSAEPVTHSNPWYEYGVMAQDRQHSLGLISVAEFLQRHK